MRKIWIDSDEVEIPDVFEGVGTPFVVDTNDRLLDLDHDGMSNAAEYHAGTDALNAGSNLAIKSLTISEGGFVDIIWRSVSGKSYVVKYTDDSVTWNVLAPTIQGDGMQLTVTDFTPSLLNQKRIFRVFVEDP